MCDPSTLYFQYQDPLSTNLVGIGSKLMEKPREKRNKHLKKDLNFMII